MAVGGPDTPIRQGEDARYHMKAIRLAGGGTDTVQCPCPVMVRLAKD